LRRRDDYTGARSGNVAEVEFYRTAIMDALPGYERDETDMILVRYTPRLADLVPGAVRGEDGFAYMPPKNGSYCALDIWVDSIVEGDHQRPRPPAPECNWLQTFPTLVKVFDPSVVVLMFSLWDTQAHHVNGRWLESGSPEWNAEMMAAAHCAISELSANGARIEIVLAPDTVQQPGPGADHLNAVYRSLAAEDPARIGIVDARVTIRNGGTGYRWDGIHYTPDGAGVLAEIARPAIVSGLALPRLLPVPPAACQPAP
jgi:hypothetical protein